MRPDLGWGLAAAIFILVAVIGVGFNTEFFEMRTGGWLRIEIVDGSLLQVSGSEAQPVSTGSEMRFANSGEWIRTAKDSGAVVALADGSKVEMAERSELYVTEKGGDSTVHLSRGSIIVEASDQGSGHLYVETGDCEVAVTGTVFSVTHGMKGSRVSVLEGEVHVEHGGILDILHPGDQITTAAILESVPVQDDIAWSRKVDEHLSLLTELADLREELDERIDEPDRRYSSRLLDLAPESTVFYVAIPNLSEQLAEGYDVLQEKIGSSETLQAWWNEQVVSSGTEDRIDTLIEKIRLFGDELGKEIVVTLATDSLGEPEHPVLLAELEDVDGFRELLAGELARISAEAGDEIEFQITDNPLAGGPIRHAESGEKIVFWVAGDFVAVSSRLSNLQHMASLAGSPGTSRFVGSPFHKRLASAYDQGVGFLVGADLGTILAEAGECGQDETLERLGIKDLQHLIIERHQDENETNVLTADIGFNQARRGVAAWLAEPASMGSLDFISPDATAVGAFVIKEPSSVLEELLDTIGGADGEFRSDLDRFQKENGIDLVRDVAGPLGGEFAFALDGPILPKPAWKLVMEVYDPAALQRTMEWAVDQVNTMAAEEGVAGLSLVTEEAGGRTYSVLTVESLGMSIHYTVVDGYLVAAPQRALVDRAIQYREAGITLASSGEFMSLLPRNGRVNFSAVAYQNLGTIVDPLIRSTLGQSKNLTPEQRAMVDSLTTDSSPSLYCAYGEKNRILLVGADRGGLFGGNLGSVFGLGSLMSLTENMPVYDEAHEDGQVVVEEDVTVIEEQR